MFAKLFSNEGSKSVADAPGIKAGQGKVFVVEYAPANGYHNGKHCKNQHQAGFQLAIFSFCGKLGIALVTLKKGQNRVNQKLKDNGGQCRNPPVWKGKEKYQKGAQQDKVQGFSENFIWYGEKVSAGQGKTCESDKI